MNSFNNSDTFWGNGFSPESTYLAPIDKWQCVEVMIKLNAPNKHDGELALWLDGKLVAHFYKGVSGQIYGNNVGFRLKKEGKTKFKGLNWRSIEDLKLNYFWLSFFVSEDIFNESEKILKKPIKTNSVLFDNVVVAKKYIGPIYAP